MMPPFGTGGSAPSAPPVLGERRIEKAITTMRRRFYCIVLSCFSGRAHTFSCNGSVSKAQPVSEPFLLNRTSAACDSRSAPSLLYVWQAVTLVLEAKENHKVPMSERVREYDRLQGAINVLVNLLESH